jgi:HSP20 family protein
MNDYNDLFDENEKLIDLTLIHKTFMNFSSRYWKPSTDIYETDDDVIVYVELAGMEKNKIHLQFQKGFLLISGFRKQFYSEGATVTHQMEIDTGRFLRKIKINIDILEDDIKAEYREGILKITLPKRRTE